MTVARSSIVPESGAGVFHCISRCVRRSWLCGVDPYNGKDYSHRKQWVRDRLEELAGIYAIEVYAYAVMSNHLHVVMRVDPGKVAMWSDSEVVLRWRRLYPAGRDAFGKALDPTPDQLATEEPNGVSPIFHVFLIIGRHRTPPDGGLITPPAFPAKSHNR